MTEFNISKTWFQINCPKCNYSFEIQFMDAKLQSIVYCHNCKCSIHLVDGNASAACGIRKIEDAFEDLNKTIKKLFK